VATQNSGEIRIEKKNGKKERLNREFLLRWFYCGMRYSGAQKREKVVKNRFLEAKNTKNYLKLAILGL